MSFISDITKTVGSVGNVIKKTYGPLAPLELPFNTNGVYRYPLDVGDSAMYPHTVEFQAWLPTPVGIDTLLGTKDGTGIIGSVKAAIDKQKSAFDKAQAAVVSRGTAGGARGGYQNHIQDGSASGIPVDTPVVNRNQAKTGRLLDFTRRAKRSDLLVMYMTAGSYMDVHNNSYNATSMTEAFGNLGLAAEAGSSVVKGYQEGEGGMLSKAWNGIKTLANSPAGAEIAANVAGLNDGQKTAGLAMMGYAVNPQEEMLYGGTPMREFLFEYMMTPRNLQEAQSIRDIVQKFKYHASPQFADNQGRFIIPPSYFDITFMFNGSRNTMLPRMSTCALTQVQVNYSAGLDTWAAFEDGMPIQVNLTLGFTELEMMHKALREEGY